MSPRRCLEAAVADARGRRLSHLELRHLEARFPHLPSKQHKVAMTLPLPAGADALWQALDRKVRNQVRKAEKSGLTASQGGRELVPEFYEVFARNMRDLGTPVYARRLLRDDRRGVSGDRGNLRRPDRARRRLPPP